MSQNPSGTPPIADPVFLLVPYVKSVYGGIEIDRRQVFWLTGEKEDMSCFAGDSLGFVASLVADIDYGRCRTRRVSRAPALSMVIAIVVLCGLHFDNTREFNGV